MTVLDVLGLVLIGKPARSQIKPAVGMGMDIVQDTGGLPMPFPIMLVLEFSMKKHTRKTRVKVLNFVCWKPALLEQQ